MSKLQKEFLGQRFFGIQAGQTTVLSRIARELAADLSGDCEMRYRQRVTFKSHGRWNGLDGPDEEPEDPCQLELALQ